MIESFDTDDFERTLRENVEDFELEPSSKVWKSIYNELHPGSKWPSLAVGIVMLIGIFWIGNSNNNSGNIASPSNKTTVKENNLSESVKEESSQKVATQKDINAVSTDNKPIAETTVHSETLNSKTSPKNDNTTNLEILRNKSTFAPTDNSLQKPASSFNELKSEQIDLQKVIGISVSEVPGLENNATPTIFLLNDEVSKVTYPKSSTPLLALPSDQSSTTLNLIRPNINLGTGIVSLSKLIGESQLIDESQIPFRGSSQRKVQKIRKAEWTFFAAPEISNVSLRGTNLNPSSSLVVTSPFSSGLLEKSSHFGFQIGTNVSYKLNDFLHVYSGFQIDYGGYNMNAKIIHPTLATVTFRKDNGETFTKNYVTYLSNKPGEGNTKLKNYALQFGIPVGVELVLFNNGHTSWSIYSDIEPFMVVSGKNYILSGDAESFVYDQDVLRRLNFNQDIGTHFTFSGKNAQWKIGPTFRYQILSSYKNIYTVKEHMFSYGLRLGISRKN